MQSKTQSQSLVKNIIVSAVAMLLLDFFYLSLISKMFMKMLMDVQGETMKLKIAGAVACYILLIGGLNYFIISKRRSLMDAFLFGIVIYGVYDTTNYATLNKWTIRTLVLDTLWGGTLMTATTWITYQL